MTETRFDSPDSLRRPRILEQLSDDDIRTADGLVLVDPDRADWQRLLWSTPISEETMTSVMLRIVEISVNSAEESEIEAARVRVAAIKRANPR